MIQTVGASWLMTTIAPSADRVALVQTAGALPFFFLSLIAGALAVELMRQPAGAEDHHVEILGIGIDRPAERLAQHVAAMPGRRRIHDDVDGKRDHRARLFLG